MCKLSKYHTKELHGNDLGPDTNMSNKELGMTMGECCFLMDLIIVVPFALYLSHPSPPLPSPPLPSPPLPSPPLPSPPLPSPPLPSPPLPSPPLPSPHTMSLCASSHTQQHFRQSTIMSNSTDISQQFESFLYTPYGVVTLAAVSVLVTSVVWSVGCCIYCCWRRRRRLQQDGVTEANRWEGRGEEGEDGPKGEGEE